MQSQTSGLDPSERIFQDLRSRNEEVKRHAALELRELVTLLSRGRRKLKIRHTGIED